MTEQQFKDKELAGNTRAKMFDAQFPDEGRVSIHEEVVE